MISGYCCTYITMDDEGRRKIKDAMETLIEIRDVAEKVNGGTTETEWLGNAIGILDMILEGKPIDC